jgi:hypothetical protein
VRLQGLYPEVAKSGCPGRKNIERGLSHVSDRLYGLLARVRITRKAAIFLEHPPEDLDADWWDFARLAVADPFADVSSLCDAVAGLVTDAGADEWDPSWSHIIENTRRKERRRCESFHPVIDSAEERWACEVLSWRHRMTHKPHAKAVHCSPGKRLLQIYDEKGTALIRDQELIPLGDGGGDEPFVDLDLLLAFTLGEALLLLDQIAEVLAQLCGVALTSGPVAWCDGDWRWLEEARVRLSARCRI